MNDDDLDYAQIAEDQEFARRIAAGEPLTPVDNPDEAAALIAQLPPSGAPVRVVRPVRLPYDVDKAVQELAARRDTTPSALIRDWVIAALEDSASLDPATELRRSLETATRAAAAIINTDRHRDAA